MYYVETVCLSYQEVSPYSRDKEVYLYFGGKVSLYSLPQPPLASEGPLHSRGRRGADRGVAPRISI